MANRERTIRGLECCAVLRKCVDNKCPYYDDYTCTTSLARDALALLREQAQVVRCTECKYWYRDSGLTARRCEKHGIITKQFDFCSYGEVVQDA